MQTLCTKFRVCLKYVHMYVVIATVFQSKQMSSSTQYYVLDSMSPIVVINQILFKFHRTAPHCLCKHCSSPSTV